MTSSSEQAVELLNQAGLETDAGRKVDHLKALLELVVRKEPALLPEFLPHVLELQCDPAPPVRKYLPDFVEAAVQTMPAPAVLEPCLRALRGLVADGTPAVAKRALLSCYMLFRTTYAMLALQAAQLPTSVAQSLWQAAQELKAAVQGMVAQAGNDAVRLNAARFLEQAAMLLTAESVPAVAGVSRAAQPLPGSNPVFSKASLVKEAEGLLGQLVAILKQKLGNEVPGPLAITVIKAAGAIAQQRPQFMGKLLPALLALANSGDFRVDAAQGGSDGAISGVQGSIANALKGALVAVSKSQQPMAVAWRKKISDGLQAMGAGSAAATAGGGGQGDRVAKRTRWEEAETNKKAKLEVVQQQQQQGTAPPVPLVATFAPVPVAPVPMQRIAPPVAAAEPLHTAVAPLPPHDSAVPLSAQTAAADLQQVQQVIQALVASKNAHTLAAFLDSLQPAVLADVVLAQLHNLPPLHSLPADNMPLEPWVLLLLQLLATQAESLQPLPAPVLQPRLPTPIPAGQLLPVQQHTLQPKPEVLGAPPAGAAAVPAAAVPVKAAVPRPAPAALTFKLEPVPLTAAQEQQLRRDAVMRILRTEKTPSHDLRASLVARLAASGAAQADGIVEAVVEQLLQDLHARGGFEIAVQWLHVLYSQLCVPFDPALSTSLTDVDFIYTGLDDSAAAMQQEAGSTSADQTTQQHAQQQRAGGGGASLSGSQYERVLLALLQGLKHHLPPSDRTVIRLLLEAPALPMPAVQQYLQDMCGAGPDWSTLGLLAARDIILQRPPNRQPALAFVLAAAAAEDEDTRGKAVRLVANRLFPEASMSAQIEQSARGQLDAMVSGLPKQEPSAAAAAAADTEQRADSQQHAEGASESQSAAAAADEQQASTAAAPTEDQAAQLCALYCALCTKKHSLLRHLFEVYGQTSAGGKAAIHRNAGGLAKTLGNSAPALLALVQQPPEGSLPLVLHMLHVLTEAAIPPQPLVAACLQLHSAVGDAQVLVPALPGMEKATVLRLLPALLDLPPEALRGALQRLLTPLSAAGSADAGQQPEEQPSEPALFGPVEILTALHTLDHNRDPKLLRKVMQAVTVCLSSPMLFPAESLAATVSALLNRVPLPQLFMRTVIQTLAAAPKLRQFVVGVLGQLVGKRIWEDSAQWKGWLMCAQQTTPDSFPALLQLPSTVLAQALQQLSESARQQLADYAASPQCTVAVPQATRDLLQAA